MCQLTSQLIEKTHLLCRKKFFSRNFLNADLKEIIFLWSFNIFGHNFLNIVIQQCVTPFWIEENFSDGKCSCFFLVSLHLHYYQNRNYFPNINQLVCVIKMVCIVWGTIISTLFRWIWRFTVEAVHSEVLTVLILTSESLHFGFHI
jgi:hypothetical protein